MEFHSLVKVSFVQPFRKKPYFKVTFELPSGEKISLNVLEEKQPAMFKKLLATGEFSHKLWEEEKQNG